jgi:hypothetical protein
MNNFKQTVNLKEELERQKEEATARSAPDPKPKPKPKPKKELSPVRKKFVKRSREIDEVYNGGDEEVEKKELHSITKPVINKFNKPLFKQAVLVIGAIIVLVVAYFMFFPRNKQAAPIEETARTNWYRIELINKEVYYGQIDDTGADPVVIRKVYYNYDQLNKDEESQEGDSNSLKLVKRGKEAYGPDDSMNIVRTQVIKMEELAENSKVLKAILDYER